MNETKNQVMVAWVAGILVGAIVALISGCNTFVGAAAGAGEGAMRDLQTGWRYATHRAVQAEDYTRDQDSRLRE